MVDFRAFDITIDGLRFGNGLLWLPDSTAAWEYTETKRPEYYQNILVKFTDLKKHTKSGQSPVFTAPGKPNLPLGTLKKWWESLSQAEKSLQKIRLYPCVKRHTQKTVLYDKELETSGGAKNEAQKLFRHKSTAKFTQNYTAELWRCTTYLERSRTR